ILAAQPFRFFGWTKSLKVELPPARRTAEDRGVGSLLRQQKDLCVAAGAEAFALDHGRTRWDFRRSRRLLERESRHLHVALLRALDRFLVARVNVTDHSHPRIARQHTR